MAQFIRVATGANASDLDKAVEQRLKHLEEHWRLSESKRSLFFARYFTIAIGEHMRGARILINPLGDAQAKWPAPLGLGWGIAADGADVLRMPAYDPTGGGLDENVFAVTQKLRLSERPRILYLGTYRDGAGLSTFFSAVKNILASQGEGILLGGLAYRDRLAPVVAHLGLAQKIIFGPPLSQNELSGLYRSADLLVYSERDPGLCYQLLDVFAHGLPVILRDTEDMRNFWGYPTLLVEGDKPEAWQEAIREVIDNSRLREVLIRRGLEFSQPHEKKQVARQWRRILEEISGEPVHMIRSRED